MSIVYPLSMPAGPAIEGLRFGRSAVVGVGKSPFTLQSQRHVHPGQQWRLTASLPPMYHRAAAAWLAFLVSLNGREGSFLASPVFAAPLGAASGAPKVDGAGQIGGILATKGWAVSTANILCAGDYIQLGSGATSQLHMVLKNVASDASGKAVLDIWPRLRKSPAVDAVIVTQAPCGVFALTSNDQDWEIDAIVNGFSFDAEEVI